MIDNNVIRSIHCIHVHVEVYINYVTEYQGVTHIYVYACMYMECTQEYTHEVVSRILQMMCLSR